MLKYNTLGKTGIKVSQICFGSLTVSPLGADLPEAEGAEVIAYALESGINFIDTAQYYQNYETIKRGMSLYAARGGRERPVICTKTYAWNRELAAEAVGEARKKLGLDVIDVFLLHEQESIHTLRGHMEALEYLYECKDQGIIRAVGLSTHCIDAVKAAAEIRHSHGIGLDVVFPMFNIEGLGIRQIEKSDESENNGAKTESENRTVIESDTRIALRDEMYRAIKRCRESGIGIMLMKVFGGGHLLGAPDSSGAIEKTVNSSPSKRAAAALRFAIDSDCGDSIALGMQSAEEVLENIRFFEIGRFSDDFCSKVDHRKRRLVVEDYCEGCGNCVRRCGQGAMTVKNGTAVCDSSKCVLCGYCAGVCPHFAIKVI